MPQRKKRKLSPTGDDELFSTSARNGSNDSTLPIRDYLQSAATWELEQDYESRPRKSKDRVTNSRLPIKTEDGRIEQVEQVQPRPAEERSDSFLDSASDGAAGDADEIPEAVPTDSRPSKEIIHEAKEEMARIASLINQAPEEYVSGLKRVAELAESPLIAVRKLALVTQLAIFQDIIPGYRIRPLGQEALLEKVSKEIKRLRAFEQSLVSSYQVYTEKLASYAKARHPADSALADLSKVALSCACALVLAVPHFNFREELLKLLTHHLRRRKPDAAHTKCVSTLEQLYRDDEEGAASLEAVGLVTRMLKAYNYTADPSVLNTFLHLRLLNEFSFKASADSVDGNWSKGKKPKQAREHRSKRQRKALKEMKEAEKEFAETDASVQREARERAQAETLKLVFGCYFRILKTREPKLMGAVLEGLARFAHLINQDFFGDLLVTLQELADEALTVLEANEAESGIAIGADSTNYDANGQSHTDAPEAPTKSTFVKAHALRSALLCTTTAFALLSSQEAASLKLDLSSFARTLYTLLLHLSMSPDLERTALTPRLLEPSSSSVITPPLLGKVNALALSTLLLRALASSLTPRHTPPGRLAAFAHRLMIAALQVPEKTGMAILTLLRELMMKQGRKIGGLWSTEEQRGEGRFEALATVDACKPYCGTIWEGELLRLHYAEGVRKGLGELEDLVKGLA